MMDKKEPGFAAGLETIQFKPCYGQMQGGKVIVELPEPV